MEIEETARIEHISLKCNLTLREFGAKFSAALLIPAMEYGFENETEWLIVDIDGLSYNISRAYEDGTLQEWDDTVPEGCNFGIALGIHKEHTFAFDDAWIYKTVANICEQLALVFRTTVYYHRTLLMYPHKNEKRDLIFQ